MPNHTAVIVGHTCVSSCIAAVRGDMLACIKPNWRSDKRILDTRILWESLCNFQSNVPRKGLRKPGAVNQGAFNWTLWSPHTFISAKDLWAMFQCNAIYSFLSNGKNVCSRFFDYTDIAHRTSWGESADLGFAWNWPNFPFLKQGMQWNVKLCVRMKAVLL